MRRHRLAVRRCAMASIALLLAALVLAGCAPKASQTADDPQPSSPPASVPASEPADSATEPAEPAEQTPAKPQPSAIAWLDTPLTDAVTGEKFKLSDYKGKPILLHAFAAW